ncbi:hypothetical protein [[Clostridium] scindens]|uniref:hypothetical protein n=1 Tax=Clostridium scindens (strain JCM 10418 / VPI 12708) TaxID=29347 RepID=UPI00298C5208|nr:hypothetical protein [[Clostridium] scindens]
MLEADVEGMVGKGLQHQVKKPPKKTKYQIKQEEIRKNKELEQNIFSRNAFDVCYFSGFYSDLYGRILFRVM